MIQKYLYNFIFATKFSSFFCYTVNIYLEKWLIRCDTNHAIWWYLYNKHISIFCIKHRSSIFRTLQVKKWKLKNHTFLSFCEINATKFGGKNLILHTITYHYMTSHGYIIMIIADSCMIWFNFDCIMQLKKLHHIATNVCSRKKCYYFCWSPWLFTLCASFRSHWWLQTGVTVRKRLIWVKMDDFC